MSSIIIANSVMPSLLMGFVYQSGVASEQQWTAQALAEAQAETGLPVSQLWRTPDLKQVPASLFVPKELLLAHVRHSLQKILGAGDASGSEGLSPRIVGGHHVDIFLGMAQARRERWTLQQFAEWLHKKLAGDAKRKYLWKIFESVIDIEVLEGKRMKPRARSSLAEIKTYAGYFGDRTSISEWVHRHRDLAKDLGGIKAFRPPNVEDAALVKRMSRGARREEIFLEASRSPGNRGLCLFQLFSKAGFYADALVAANILYGIHDGERLSTTELQIEGYHERSVAHIEVRLEALARKYGFALKERPSVSQTKSLQIRLGMECRKLFLLAKQEGWDVVRFLGAFRSHPPLRELIGSQTDDVGDIIARAIRYVVREEALTSYSIHRDEFEPRGIGLPRFYGWWQKSMQWIEALGLPREK